MKLSQTFGALTALFSLANAVNIPGTVIILTPQQGNSVGVNGKGWMIDVVGEFSPPNTTSSTPTTTSITDGFVPFLNSPNLTTFKPGPDPAAPGFVCLVNTSSDPTINYAGVFQLNAVTKVDEQGNILGAYWSWFIGSAAFGSNVNSLVTVFFLNDTAPAKYTGDPNTDPAVISNVANVTFFIFGDSPSNTTAASTQATPLSINVFTPRTGQLVGIDGAGWMIDMVITNSDLGANYFRPTNGFKTLYHDNFTDPQFKPGVVSEAVPGLVVLSNTTGTAAGGPTNNLANLFQINAVTAVQNGVITEYWCTWLIGAAFSGAGQPSSLTIFVVNGTAPTNITGALPSGIISDIQTVNFTLAGNATGSSTSGGSSGSSSTSGSAGGSPTGSPSPTTSAKSDAGILSVSIGSIALAVFAFLL